MCPSMEGDDDLLWGNGHIGRHGDQITEDLSCLGVSIATDTLCKESIESTGHDEESHVEIDLEGHGGRECVHVEEADGIADGVFDEHSLGVAGNELDLGEGVVCEENGRLVMAQVEGIELTERVSADLDLLLIDPGCLEGPGGDIELNLSPGGGRERLDLSEKAIRSTPEGDEPDVHVIKASQVGEGRELGVENDVWGILSMLGFPEVEEGEDLLGLFAFSDVSTGVAEGAVLGILDQKDEDTGFSSAPARDVVFLDDGILSVEGNGVEIEIE